MTLEKDPATLDHMSETKMPPLHDVVKKVREIAKDAPDLVYEMPDGWCQYVFNGQGSCIVGQAYLELGTPIKRVESWDNEDSGPLGVEQVIEREYEEYSTLAKSWLREVQDSQDTGTSWAEAVKNADISLGLI